MVEAIGIAILSAVGTSAAVSTTVGILGVSLATIVGTTAVFGGSLLISSLTSSDTKQKVQSQQFSSKQSIPPRRRAYGELQLAGPKVEYRSSGGKFFNAIYHCEGPIDSYRYFLIEDKKAALPVGSLGGNVGVAPWNANVVIEAHLGYPDQAASVALQLTGAWTLDDRLRGCAYSLTVSAAPSQKDFPKRFPSGTWPEHRVGIRGALVWNINDPNQSADSATWKWSDNATLCIRDHLTHPLWGLKVPNELIDMASFRAAANLDAQPVVNKNGDTFPRYFIGGAFDLTDEPADALQGMLDAKDGRLYLTAEGKIGISGGVWVEPDVIIVDPNILSTGQIEIGSGKRAAFNRQKLSYVSPQHDFQVIEGDPWENLDAQEEAGETLEADFARQWVQNHNQLRRLAKINEGRKNPQYRITGIMFDRSGLPALFEDVIRLTLTLYAIDAVFQVERAVAAQDGSSCTFDLVSITQEMFEFNPQTEEGRTPALPGQSEQPEQPANPVDLTAEVDRIAVNGTTNATFLVLTADEPVRQDLSLIGRYRTVSNDGPGDWVEMVSDTDSRGRVRSNVLVDGQAYEAEGAIAGYGRASQSDWVPAPPSPITAIADNSSTGAPESFTVNGEAGQARGAFSTPNVGNYGSTRVFRSKTNSFATANSIGEPFYGAGGQAFDFIDSPLSAGTYYYWARAYNRSGFGDASSTSGPVTVTVI